MIGNIKILKWLFLIAFILGIGMFVFFKQIGYKYAAKIGELIIILGATLFLIGITLNLIVINTNGGKMPVSATQSEIVHDGRHEEINEKTKYKILADNFYFSFPCKGMYSIGDIIAEFGIIMFCGTMFSIILLSKSKNN